MKYFTRVIQEIRSVLNALALFETLLDVLLVFLLFFAVFTFVGVSVLFAFIPASFALVVLLHHRMSRNKLLAVEQKYPVLKEKLRTAADNITEENPVVNELHEDIVSELRNVEASSFINMAAFSYKIMIALLLSMSLVVAAQYQVDLDFKKVLFENPLIDYIKKNQEANREVNRGPIRIEGFGEASEIMGGDANIIRKGSDALEVLIDTPGYELNLQDVQDREEDIDTFPSELCYQTAEGCEAAESFNENIPKENTDLIKKYFKNLAQAK
ncbi:hypothetical protein HYV81_04200 [Candidatus Woesearchaeota archaeon]|nr:hypothetical protein [Candidatus Woesearchaeota archaeon]